MIFNNWKWLCKIGLHNYKFLEYWPKELQFKPACKHEQAFLWWKEKCDRCGKIASFNDFIK